MPWFFVLLEQRYVRRVLAVHPSHVGQSMPYFKVLDIFQPTSASRTS